jgi:dienelactone hydrolase
MDLTKLVVGGHSFGGITAVSVGHRDERVKAVFSFDPWTWPKNEDISDHKLKLNIP